VSDVSQLAVIPPAAFFVLAAIVAIVASLERVLGRPFPRLRHSPTLRKNRAFWAVPVLMAATVAWLLPLFLAMNACSDCSHPHMWQHPAWVVWISTFALGISAVVGWLVYYALLISTSVARLLLRL